MTETMLQPPDVETITTPTSDPELDGESTDIPVTASPRSTAHTPAQVGRTNEQSMGRAVRLGALIGIPATFFVAFMIGILGGAGVAASAAIGFWVGGFGSGTYLGGIFFLPSGPDHTSTTR